jgi:hypothetical protein
MQLTLPQISLLTEAAREAVSLHTGRAVRAQQSGNQEGQTFWLNEAEMARQLVHTLTDALSVTVESVPLTPAMAVDAANPASKQAFEKMHEVISASLAASPEHDLQAAARLLYQQRGYKPHLPPLTLAPGGCPESPAALHAAPAQTTASVQHPTKVSSLHLSSTQHGEACGDIHCDGNCPDPRAQPSTTVNHGQPASTPL